MAEVPGWPGRPPHGASSDDYTAIHDSVPVAHSGEPKGEDTRTWTIFVCARCAVHEAVWREDHRRCWFNKSHEFKAVAVVPGAALAQALEERDRLDLQVKNLTSYCKEAAGDENVLLPVSTLEQMGRQRDELSDEVHELRRKLALIPPALLSAALAEPHGASVKVWDELSARAEAALEENARLKAAIEEVLKRQEAYKVNRPIVDLSPLRRALSGGTESA